MSFALSCGSKNTKRLKIMLIAGVLLCAPLLSAAQEGQAGPMRLSPADAVDLAIRNNLGLESARISTSTARRAADLSWNQFVPELMVSGSLLRLNEAAMVTGLIPVPETAVVPGGPMMVMPFAVDGPRWLLNASLSATLNFSFAMIEEMNRLRIDYDRGRISYARARAQLERDIRKAYHNILLLQENIALLHGSLENADRQVQIAQANYNAGLAPELTLLQAQVGRENLRPVIDQAEGGLRLLMMQFSMFLGLPHETEFELIPIETALSPVNLDTAALIGRASTDNLDIQELRQTILLMESGRTAMRLGLFTPFLSLGWNADPMFVGLWDQSLTDGDLWNQQSGALRFTVGFRLNGLLPFGAERQGLRSLEDQIRTVNIGLAQMIRGTEIQIHNLVQTLEQIKLTMGALEQTVALAERSFTLTEQAHRAGLIDLFQVQNAEMSLRQARVQLHEQQFNYLNSLIDLEYALGVPFGSLTSTGNFN
ncbi:MAG: TolC family protein [Treponema sp.]|nr:TolC family protein [Treponema sp.]